MQMEGLVEAVRARTRRRVRDQKSKSLRPGPRLMQPVSQQHAVVYREWREVKAVPESEAHVEAPMQDVSNAAELKTA